MTPNGLADAVVDNHFVLPYENMMEFTDFLKALKESSVSDQNGNSFDPVYYLQSQNDNLRKDATLLPFLEKIPKEIDFVSSSLGRSPDAVNLWIGNHRSTTTLHRDQYQNIYYVAFGTKVFTLIPPTDSFYLTEGLFPTVRYKPNGLKENSWTVEPVGFTTPWIKDYKNYPNKPLVVHVKAGQSLYIPACCN
jgi:jumonji domain-containing protein 7